MIFANCVSDFPFNNLSTFWKFSCQIETFVFDINNKS